MRPLELCIAAIMFTPLLATAGPRGGHGGEGGGGPLHSTSSGLGSASRGGGGGGGGGSSGTIVTTQPERPVYVEDIERTQAPAVVGGETIVVVKRRVRRGPPPPFAHFEGYAGVSKVYDSDQSVSAELGIVDDWFRVDGSYTRYYEAQPGMDSLQLSVPKLTFGVRIHDTAAKIYLTGGAVGAKTKNDPVMDSSFAGILGGVRLEMPLGDLASLVGNAELMVFSDDVTATGITAGVRVGPVQASLRVLDFNVGPPLWGPELGVRF